ncbi:MAG: hypothetical protein K8R87_03085 [Verrucomicrobia bacterium]|nr:hypothetical protein [Verrucomicrobiota bacterium]
MQFSVCLMGPVLFAHTVPTITVEAEFSAGREITLRVNLDPRLFLSEQPTSLPPVPATWWFEQNEAARASSLAAAQAYLEKNILFQAGDFRIGGGWTVVAIDSSSTFPIGPNSAEVHFLAEHRGSLPDDAGDFKVTLDQRAAVGLILLNSTEGKAERHPQAIFPGESSRGFKLPEMIKADAKSASTVVYSPAPAGSGHFAADHLLVALVLAWLFRGRYIFGMIMITVFQLSHVITALAVTGAWLPDAPFWMLAAGWIALAAALLLSHQRQLIRAAACFSVAGLCHGLNVSHLHLAAVDIAAVLREAGLTGAMQLAVFTLASVVLTMISRRRRRGKTGMELC